MSGASGGFVPGKGRTAGSISARKMDSRIEGLVIQTKSLFTKGDR